MCIYSVPKLTCHLTLLFQEGLPLKIKGAHFLNPPPLFFPSYHVGIRFLKDKIRKRVQLHNSYESLHKSINKDILPTYYGGSLSEEEATETHVLENILKMDVPYEG